MGPDGNLWFTGMSLKKGIPTAGYIGRVTPAGRVRMFRVPSGAFPTAITRGPDRALWFAAYGFGTPGPGSSGPGFIGRITTAGAITLRATPNAGPGGRPGAARQVLAIVAGPDGNVWATGQPNDIYRITPKGAITTFTTPAPGGPAGVPAGPGGIAVGPDRNLWVTETGVAPGSDHLLRVTPTGRMTAFGPFTPLQSTPADEALSGAIISGPSGRIFFGGLNYVASVTPTGLAPEFLLTNTGSAAMTKARDGGVLMATGQFDVPGPAHLQAITTSGTVVDEGPLPIPSFDAMGIAQARDGTVWVGGAKTIVRFSTPR